MAEILLCSLNARYIHSSLGLRYLYANMGELQARTEVIEFTLEPWSVDLAEQLLAHHPRIIGFGVYIWNCEQTTRLVKVLKQLRPEINIVLGGPEVSHEWEQQEICRYADHIVIGQADLSFPELSRALLQGETPPRIVQSTNPPLAQLALPYPYYSDEDIAHRVLYVEASRGCPFHCEFCLSALDKTAWGFPLDPFLEAIQELIDRGARHFKFVDRTFNLDTKVTSRILEFFRDRIHLGLYLHFELIPDRLPEVLKSLLPGFPPGSLQFEVGIQSFNPDVQTLISRRQENDRSIANLDWLTSNTTVHLHADLIIGLPGEDLASFADGFDRLYRSGVEEIQVGILKRLRGTPIIRHTDTFSIRYNPNPPYEILENRHIDFPAMQRLTRFARYWEMIANSGRFRNTLPALLDPSPFERFLLISDWLFSHTGQVHRIALKRLFNLVHIAATEVLEIPQNEILPRLLVDFRHSGVKGVPGFMQGNGVDSEERVNGKRSKGANARQQRHLGG